MSEKLKKSVEDLVAAERVVMALEKDLKAAKARLAELSKVTVPEAMDEAGMNLYRTLEGVVVEVVPNVQASIPEAKRPEAMKWLELNGGSGIIKRSVRVLFGRGEQDEAEALSRDLSSKFKGAVAVELKVEPQTLKKFVRDRLSKGEEVDMELLGIHDFREAKVKGVEQPAFDEVLD